MILKLQVSKYHVQGDIDEGTYSYAKFTNTENSTRNTIESKGVRESILNKKIQEVLEWFRNARSIVKPYKTTWLWLTTHELLLGFIRKLRLIAKSYSIFASEFGTPFRVH